MIFTTAGFVVFFAIFWPAYLLLRGRGKKIRLLFASYAFYASWSL
jgi:hypothetical protein